MEERISQIELELRRIKRVNHAQTTEITKLRKILVAGVAAIAIFWWAGDRTNASGNVQAGELLQIIGLLAGGGTAVAATVQHDSATIEEEFDGTEEA